MANLLLQLILPDSERPVPVQCPDDVPVTKVIRELARRFQLPEATYSLRVIRDGHETELGSVKTLFENGITRHEELHLVSGSASRPLKELFDKLTAENVPAKGLLRAATATQEPVDLEPLLQMVNEIREKVDRTDQRVVDAFDELTRMIVEAKSATADTTGGGGTTGGNGTGQGNGGDDDGPGDDGRHEHDRRKRDDMNEMIAALRALHASIGERHGDQGVDVRVHELELELQTEEWKHNSVLVLCVGAVGLAMVMWTHDLSALVITVAASSITSGVAYLRVLDSQHRSKKKRSSKSRKSSSLKPGERTQ